MVAEGTLQNRDGSQASRRASGGGTSRVLRHVTIPLLRPALIDSAMLIFALCLEILGIPLFLGRPEHISFIASYLYDAWSNGSDAKRIERRGELPDGR